MAITAASVEANGWVLRLTLTGSRSTTATSPDTAAQWAANFAAYAAALTGNDLAAGATPAITLAGSSSGYVQSGGVAVASSSVARSLAATKVLRKPVASGDTVASRQAKTPDETDNGDGTITVRIALSQHVYAGDTGLTLAVVAGWRSGESAAFGISVTNNSTVPAPAPIVRWADVPYRLVAGSFALEVAVAAFHPVGLAPVAGVKFTVTDGTTVKSFWATALSASSYGAGSANGTGQAPRVYAATVDPTTATALTKGLLRCDFEVYPWLGPVQKSDLAGTRSMTGLGTASTVTTAFAPLVVAYNPVSTFTASISGTTMTVSGFSGYPLFVGAHITGTGVAQPTVITALGTGTGGNGTYTVTSQTVASTTMQGQWIPVRYAYVDPVGGTATAAAANVSTSATAAATTPLSSINLAIQSLYLQSYTIAAANGQAAQTRACDGAFIRLKSTGVVLGTGTTGVTFGATNAITWLTVEGDPADGNPLANCILRSPSSANAASQMNRVRFRNLSVEAQTNIVFAVANAWADGIEVRGVSGQEATTGPPFAATGAFLWVTNTKWWKHGTSAKFINNQTILLARNVSVEREVNAPLVANCARLPTATSSSGMALSTTITTDAGYALERIAVGCDMRYLTASGMAGNSVELANANAPATLTLGTTYPVLARYAVLNCVAEIYSGPGNPLWSDAAIGTTLAASEIIVEGNTFIGDRTNNFYNDLTLNTVEQDDTENSQCRTLRFANNISAWNASKHDRYHNQSYIKRSGVTLASIRSKAYVAYNTASPGTNPANCEVVTGGNLYWCATAGTTAATGGPTGTGSAIGDGSVVWQWQRAETRQHGFRPQATGMWSSHYGVGYEGNVDLQSPSDSHLTPDMFFEFYGLGSTAIPADGLTITTDPFTNDQSGTANKQPYQPASPTGGGNYKPLASGSGTYILGRGRKANVDVDQAGVVRGATFAAGALESTMTVLAPASARQAGAASSPAAKWSTTLAVAGGRLATRAAATMTGWTATIAPAPTRHAQRATSPGVQWAATLAVASGRLASRAAATAAQWRTTLAVASARLASTATSSAVTWTAVLAIDGARSAMAATSSHVTWAGSLTPAGARSAMIASSPAVAAFAPQLIAIDHGRIAMVDRTLPILLPGWSTPADRTLTVVGDFRTITID